MFAQQGTNLKRTRDEDEETLPSGFSEHRTKRHITTLPHRTSPRATRNVSPTFSFNTHYTSQPAPPTITPADSDSEETPLAAQPRSFFSPYSSPQTAATPIQSDSPSPWLELPTHDSPPSSQISMSEAPPDSDDFEMTDSVHLSPGSFHSDPSTSITGRIPTPIHSSFAPFIRAEKASTQRDTDFADDEALVDRFRRGRRLPSPISEGETSPSVIVAGFSDMQMEIEHDKDTPTKKGHQRSKHSLRSWTGYDMGGSQMKRSFSMGYRADCEKCRMRVPGHFSHIITY